ncbi:MAG: hypothetical protein WCU88_03100 [Elusimicrobiota bacterium]
MRIPSLRFFCAALVLASLAAGCKPPEAQDRHFTLTGIIKSSPGLRGKIERPNTVLFIIASNVAGIPVAVKRIINPRLPTPYQMNEEDLVLPGPVWKGVMSVKVHLTTHGQAGLILHGDLTGRHSGPVYCDDQNVDVTVDNEA